MGVLRKRPPPWISLTPAVAMRPKNTTTVTEGTEQRINSLTLWEAKLEGSYITYSHTDATWSRTSRRYANSSRAGTTTSNSLMFAQLFKCTSTLRLMPCQCHGQGRQEQCVIDAQKNPLLHRMYRMIRLGLVSTTSLCLVERAQSILITDHQGKINNRTDL